ncbi:hypothetical protein Q1695_008192 [Nippostrongylus brasiliensis]|nr:hypothetical protein Q1695_008192 [Nippostrongylus brasiliensis]
MNFNNGNDPAGIDPDQPCISSNSVEWVEIVEPQTKQHMYANLISGQCSWEPPPGASVKRTHENQWWELFDSKTGRYYYYNAASMKTIWQRPIGPEIDIIPLAKLQTLKENTESAEHARVRRTCETQTSPAIRRVVGGSRRIVAQNIGPEAGVIMTRTASRSSNGTVNGMQQSFDWMSIDDQSDSLSIGGDRCDYRDYNRDFGRSPRQFPPFPTMGTTSTMSTAPSADSIPARSSRSSSPPVQKRQLFPTNTGPKKSTNAGGWTKEAPKQPLSAPDNKQLKKDSPMIFKLIQGYMGDRKSKIPIDQQALTLCELGVSKQECADEAVAQLMQQLTDNERPDSVRRGWELLAIVLNFVTPSEKQALALAEFIDRNSEKIFDRPEVAVSHFAQQCAKRLSKSQIRPKPSLAAVQEARVHIFNPPQFSASLSELMEMQNERYPQLRLPWIETTLIELLYESGARRTEGLFRVPADPDQLMTTRARLDMFVVPVVHDPHVPAGLLKLWLRQLPEPLIPHAFYQRALASSENPAEVARLVQVLPNINQLVLTKLVSCLQDLSREEVVAHTKMDASNLAMVMAPNVLRCESEDPRVIFENTRREMTFLKTLITSYETSFIQGLV